jgi:hypothetical protein
VPRIFHVDVLEVHVLLIEFISGTAAMTIVASEGASVRPGPPLAVCVSCSDRARLGRQLAQQYILYKKSKISNPQMHKACLPQAVGCCHCALLEASEFCGLLNTAVTARHTLHHEDQQALLQA